MLPGGDEGGGPTGRRSGFSTQETRPSMGTTQEAGGTRIPAKGTFWEEGPCGDASRRLRSWLGAQIWVTRRSFTIPLSLCPSPVPWKSQHPSQGWPEGPCWSHRKEGPRVPQGEEHTGSGCSRAGPPPTANLNSAPGRRLPCSPCPSPWLPPLPPQSRPLAPGLSSLHTCAGAVSPTGTSWPPFLVPVRASLSPGRRPPLLWPPSPEAFSNSTRVPHHRIPG